MRSLQIDRLVAWIRQSVFLGLFGLMTGAGVSQPANISVVIVSPQATGFVDDPMLVEVTAQGTFEIRSVTASVGGETVGLVFGAQAIPTRYDARAGWTNRVSLASLSPGQHTVRITATDALGNQADAEGAFEYEPKPVLTVRLPADGALARPVLSVDVECSDNDPDGCVVEMWVNPYRGRTPVASANRVLKGEISLGNFNHRMLDIQFRARDSVGQITTLNRRVYVESNPQLKLLASVPGDILDVNDERILYQSHEVGRTPIWIRERSTGHETSASADAGADPRYGYLTPHGAIYVGQPGSVLASRVIEWRDGAAVDLGQANSATSLEVKGKYALWNMGMRLNLRDLESGTTTIVSETTGNIQNDLTEQGTVAYWSSSYQVYRYQNGATQQLTSDLDFWNTYPRTDGRNVVYRKHMTCCGGQTDSLMLHDGVGEMTLVPAQSRQFSPEFDYQVKNGWVAYRKPGTSGQQQIWVRTPSGDSVQRTFFGSDSGMDLLGADGEVLFRNATQPYISLPGGGLIQLCQYSGITFLIGNTWHVRMGGHLFELQTHWPSLFFYVGNAAQPRACQAFEVDPPKPGEEFIFESSTDLVVWEEMARHPAAPGVTEYVQIPAVAAEKQFYRLLVE